MMGMTSRAAAMLKEKLLESCYDAGIGFRIFMVKNDRREKTLIIKPDRAKEGDKVLELDGVRIFIDPECAALASERELDYTDEPQGTLFIK